MERQISFTLPSPSPDETPFRTPSSSLSRRSRDYDDRSPGSTPPPLPLEARLMRKRSIDSQSALDETLSPLDPRRFTPTLHASLVSEILSLRRDLENKTKSIDQLEQSLDNARSQNEGLSKSLLASNKETRSVKRQMQLLEGGTLSALNELSKERDEAVKDTRDLRKRLEQAQKRAKNHEENADRTQSLWDKDKDSWAAEKRALENRVHVAEGRLQAIVTEFAQTRTESDEQVDISRAQPDEVHHRSEGKASAPGSPVTYSSPEFRRRRQSTASTTSDQQGGRMSALSFVNGTTTNLADELALDDIEEDEDNEISGDEDRTSPEALAEERERPMSSLSIKARRVLGLAFDIEQMENHGKSHSGAGVSRKSIALPASALRIYVDSGVQYSPPPSPTDASEMDAYSEALSTIPILDGNPDLVHSEAPIMVSSSCQTVEYLPSPPLTPKQDSDGLATVDESTSEKREMKDISTQTDVRPRPGGSRYIHSRTSTHDLGIPAIAIIPPTSRPATPETSVVLPPRTRNAFCQVESEVLSRYTTSSMQTEEIRIDQRSPALDNKNPSAVLTEQPRRSTSKTKLSSYTRRGSSQAIQPTSNSSSKRSALQSAPVAPVNDDGPLSLESSLASSRPVRSSSLFAGFDDVANAVDDEVDEDVFYEDDHSNRPTARYTLRSGKLVSQESTVEDVGEPSAISAGEAMAMDNLRRSDSMLPPELRQFDLPDHSKNPKRQNVMRRAPSATKSANVRRSALISNGVAAHASRHSQSTIESGSNDGSIPPPIPIPLRYSSARIGKSYSESGRNSRGSSNASPTRQHRSKYRPALRKARSGPAISPAAQARRPRSKSPPLDSRVSIVPEMPLFEMPGQTPYDEPFPLTNDFVNDPADSDVPQTATTAGPKRSQTHIRQPSEPAVVQQTSVVDAIAQTMVGEWMYKYVRRRKSFGKVDRDWDPNKSVEELTNNPNVPGVRHKRWVWLAPYERSVMWSSKQPMNGTALLGKSGRKLIVKSVLDVKDDNPMPKNSLTGPVFNRSILVLTPQRALKFTATNQERHFVWLTALSFLSHSPLSIGDVAALPPAPDDFRIPSPPPVAVGGSFRRRTLRDSIRIAKAPGRQIPPQRAVTDTSLPLEQYNSRRPSTRDIFDADDNAAMPPTISRIHTRNRSNTAPRPPQSSYVSFSYRDVGPSPIMSQNTYSSRQQTPSIGYPSRPTTTTRRGSEASAFGRPNLGPAHSNYAHPNVFSFSDSSHNASMTMRMDAFIDNKQAGKGGFRNLRLAGPSRPSNKDVNKELIYWGNPESASTTSPVESLTQANTGIRLSDSTGRGSTERDFGTFRAF